MVSDGISDMYRDSRIPPRTKKNSKKKKSKKKKSKLGGTKNGTEKKRKVK